MGQTANSGALIFIFYAITGLLLLGGVWWLAARVWFAVVTVASAINTRAPRTAQPAGPRIIEHEPMPARPAPRTAHAPMADRARAAQLHELTPGARMHTLIAARPGDGKTTALNTLVVADVRAGAQTIVLNPHFTAYHPEDQPIDLRPLAAHFEAVYDYAHIEATLRALVREIDARMPIYRAGQDVGHVISVLIDEWPAVQLSEYAKSCTDLLGRIVREGRKCKVFVTIATQDAQVSTLGFSGGLRSSFATRLCGNVDNATWRACMGDAAQRPVARGVWASDRGDVMVTPPTAIDVRAAAMGEPCYSAIEPHSATDSAIAPSEPDSIAWAERVRDLAAEGYSTREIREMLGGDYNRIVKLAREGREGILR